MPHNPEARREATAWPVILFGDRGRTVESYRPAEEELHVARPAIARHEWVPVVGPHLRVACARDRRSKTGVVGICISRMPSRRNRLFFVVNLGSTSRRFCIDTLGREEAWRRAVALRREHVIKVAQANAIILRAREATKALR